MRAYALSHLSDRALLRDLARLIDQERNTTAELVAHIAEVDSRRLYAPAGYPSMYEYCVRHLHLPEQSALKRIRAGRAARRFPAIFPALAEGRLHLSGVILLAPYLTPENAEGLLSEAINKSKAEIEMLLAQRFPRLDVPAGLEAIVTPLELSPGTVHESEQALSVPVGQPESEAPANARARVAQLSPGTVETPCSNIAPLAPQRFALKCTIDQETHDLLSYAQSLMSHRVASGDPAQVLKRALESLVRDLEKRKFAATSKPRMARQRKSLARRTIPAHVKRAVWQRDRGRCTFVGTNGHRCEARTMLEYDHANPVARSGEATVEGIRLRCRAHNQLEAERMFGAGFMDEKREAARRERERRHAATSDPDVIASLRTLGYRADESRRAAALCETIPDASLENRVKLALSYFRPRMHAHRPAAGHPATDS